MSRLESKVAIVTGAAGGIGRASAIRLAGEGAAVVVADVNEPGAKAVSEEINASGGESISHALDLAVESEIQGMVEAAVSTFGGLDIVHNNAAATGDDTLGSDVDIVNTDVEVWDRTMVVNVRSAMLVSKHAIPQMIKRGGGSIVNMSSAAGLSGDLSRVAYGVSKGAINALTMNTATMYGKQRVRCNAIAPGIVMTPAAKDLLPQPVMDIFIDNHLTPQLCLPEDIAAVVAFLASDDSSFITGEVIRVDGGMLSHLPMYAQLAKLMAAG